MSGILTNGMIVATLPLTGNEQVAVDTLLPAGQNPQSEAINLNTIKGFVLGNGVTALPAGVATAVAGAATLNGSVGTVTSEALTTAAGSDYTLTLTDSSILATSIVFATVANGTNTTEGLAVNRVQPGNGSAIIHIRNTHASAALNGTIKVGFQVIN